MLARFKLAILLIILCNSIQLSSVNITIVNKTDRKVIIELWCNDKYNYHDMRVYGLAEKSTFNFKNSSYKNLYIKFIVDDFHRIEFTTNKLSTYLSIEPDGIYLNRNWKEEDEPYIERMSMLPGLITYCEGEAECIYSFIDNIV